MSVKSIEHRLCCGFYDMAWLNLSAGIENLPEDSGELTKQWLSAALPMVKALQAGELSEVSEGTEKLLALRGEIAARVESLTTLRAEADVLRKAVERKASALKEMVPVDTDDEVRSLLSKIFAGNDPMMMNLRVQAMVGAFPARMTKTRFYDLLSGYLSLYNGQDDGEGLQAFCYRVRSAAGIGDASAASAETAACLAKAREVMGSDAAESAAKETELAEIAESLSALTKELDGEIGLSESLVRCINPLAAIGILDGVQDTLAEDSSVASDLAPAVLCQLKRAAGQDTDDAEYEKLTAAAHDAMEQFFEPLSVLTETETGRLQSAIDAMDEETATAYIPVMKAARLLSTSAFASLSEEAAPAATPERVEACRDTLFKELSERFDGMPKALVREWMAEVCAELPVWFANRTEVMEYMQQSLRGCRTNGERRYAIAELRKKLG